MENSTTITGIIIADDDIMIRNVLRSKLEAIGQKVFLASNGLEAVELASRMQAMLIMLDLNMRPLNGLLTCQRLRQLPGYMQTPIVILTAHHGRDAETAAKHIGATAFLTKPFRLAEVLQVLSQFMPINEDVRKGIHRTAKTVAAIAHAAQPQGLVTEPRETLRQIVNSAGIKRSGSYRV